MTKLIPFSGAIAPEAEDFAQDLAVDTLARTLWGEARGEGSAGMQAVACVILNRVKIAEEKGGYWWGDNVITVCQKPYQFSCWNRSDPNYRQLIALDKTDRYFGVAQNIARAVMRGLYPDPTGGATHYHAVGMLPYWARGEKPVTVIGNHIFYRLR